jgi:hypothetical protein
MSACRWGWVVRWWAAVLAAGVLAGSAMGQDGGSGATGEPGPTAEDGPVMVAGFGWGNVMPADRWAPVTVYITTAERPIAGTIVMEYPQDSTQRASIEVPFAATPNRTTPVQIVAALPPMCERVSFSMYSESGRLIRTLNYSNLPSALAAQLPPLVDPTRGVVVSVGRSSLPEAVRDWTRAAMGQRGVGRGLPQWAGWDLLEPGRISADELPITWAAYDGVSALVVHADTASPTGELADPRSLEAIHEWVAGGGRLIVVADAPGDGWKMWLPPEARGAVEPEPVATLPVSDEIGTLLAEAERAAVQRGADAEAGEEIVHVPPAAASVTGRILRTTAAGRNAGWSVRWKVDGSGGAGLLAEGPSGYGFVAVLGADPAKVMQTLSTRGAGVVWRDALGSALGDELKNSAAANQQGGWWGNFQTPTQRATNTALERLGNVPVIGDWLFLVIAGCIVALAAMVGPVDYFVLKRLKSGHRSWLTALVWIVAASGLAYSVPRAVRAAPTQINRLTVVDRMLPRAGWTAGEGAAPLTLASGMTGIYAGESGRLRFLDPDPTAWWRGVSIHYPWLGEMQNGASLVVPTVQAAAGGAAGSERGNPVTVLPVGLWTFRTLADMSRPGRSGAWSLQVGSITGRVREAPEGYGVQVAGLPGGVMVTGAALRIGNQWHSLTMPRPAPEPATQPIPPSLPRREDPPPPPVSRPVGESGDTVWSATFPAEYAGSEPPQAWANPPPDPGLGYYPYHQTVDLNPGPLLDLQGPWRRGQALERRLASGRWAAVYLNIEKFPLDTPVGWPSRSEHTCVLRLLVPLEGAGGAGTTGGAEDPKP